MSVFNDASFTGITGTLSTLSTLGTVLEVVMKELPTRRPLRAMGDLGYARAIDLLQITCTMVAVLRFRGLRGCLSREGVTRDKRFSNIKLSSI